jgi:predicted DNA-binding ribbon-helix-helix protein
MPKIPNNPVTNIAPPAQLNEVIAEVVDRMIAQRKDATIAALVTQIDEKNARIRALEAERVRLSWMQG